MSRVSEVGLESRDVVESHGWVISATSIPVGDTDEQHAPVSLSYGRDGVLCSSALWPSAS